MFDWPLIPRWPLCHTGLRNAGCPGPETGSLGVKKRLGGWGNHIAGRDSLSVCLYMFTICTCPFRVPPSPPRPSPEGTIPASVSTCKPGPPCSLCPGSFRPPGNANCQRRCFTGSGRCVRWGFLSSSVARSPSHFWKTLTAHSRIQVVEQTQVWVKITLWTLFEQWIVLTSFLWLLIRTTGMSNFPYLDVTDKLFAFGKY